MSLVQTEPLLARSTSPGVPATAVAAQLEAARAAQSSWAATPLRARLAVLRRLRQAIAENALEISHSIASPNRAGMDSLAGEVLPLCDGIRFLEKHASSGASSEAMDRARAAAFAEWAEAGNPQRTVRRDPDHQPGQLSAHACRGAARASAVCGKCRSGEAGAGAFQGHALPPPPGCGRGPEAGTLCRASGRFEQRDRGNRSRRRQGAGDRIVGDGVGGLVRPGPAGHSKHDGVIRM